MKTSIFYHLLFVFVTQIGSAQNTFEKVYVWPNIEHLANSICLTYDNSYVAAGWKNDFQNSTIDAFIMKIDALGDTVWTKTHGGNSTDDFKYIIQTFGNQTESDEGYDVIQTDDKSYVVTGYTINNWNDLYIVKTDTIGNVLWTQTYGDTNYQCG